jgi:type IV pilus assembly protein PilA
MKNLQTIKHNAQKGFTLIELMIVVAIIGILAALAIPAYTDYTIKSRVGEGASVAGPFKTAMEVYWSEKGNLSNAWVTGNQLGSDDLGLSPISSPYVSSLAIGGTAALPYIAVELRTSDKLGTASGDCFKYTPYLADAAASNLSWMVEGATAETSVMPGTPVYVDGTAITSAVVPAATTAGLTTTTCSTYIPAKYKPKR